MAERSEHRPDRRRPDRRDGDFEEALAEIRRRGGRVTPTKRAIVTVVHGASEPLTAEQVHERVAEADAATVYRTLNQLEELGIVRHHHITHGAARYRWAGVPTMPVVCEACGAVAELRPDEYAPLARTLERRHHMVLLPGHFALTGRCQSCDAHAMRTRDPGHEAE